MRKSRLDSETRCVIEDKMNDTRSKKEKNQHIQVFARVRPINSLEKTSKSRVIVDVPTNKDVVVQDKNYDKLTKKFSFDKVFGPASKQIDVYNAVVSPLLEEVLAGYNCTVFAYGQTGSGKTFTMEGSCNDPSVHWQADTLAGIIPRALSHLFDELRTLGAQEFTVRVSFLELYNEELFDLLSPNDDASKIRIYEDVNRKGSIIIHGLEEVTVHNKSEVYKILEKGSEKRQTAATLMNAHSSRSHTVFSITVHIKENTVDGEELLKTGKLNLVDLAGSENVGRSGAVGKKAHEAGNINQSLLTLGRVITALVERAPHVPYRESKLTRLLQESLGGRTKTSIIATISPACINSEETISTLDYAHRAKNITNRPEINQKLSKKALLKEYTEEIERLRRDLLATRERNGVYLAQENYAEMQSLIKAQCKEIEEKINHIKAVEEIMQNKEKVFEDLKIEFESTSNTLYQTKEKLESTKNDLITTKTALNDTSLDRDLQKHLVQQHVLTENSLLNQAKTLLNVADTATTDNQKLYEKINRKKKVEEINEGLGQQFKQEMGYRFKSIQDDLGNHTQELFNFCESLKSQIQETAAQQNKGIDSSISLISNHLLQEEMDISDKLTKCSKNAHDEYYSWVLEQFEQADGMTEKERESLKQISKKFSSKIHELVENKISENLKSLHNETSLKLISLTNIVRKSTDELCNLSLLTQDNLNKQIDEMKNTIELAVENQNQIVQHDDKISKMFADLKSQFDDTWKHYETFAIEKKNNHSILQSKLKDMSEQSNNIRENNISSCSRTIKKEKAIEDQIEKHVDTLRSEVTSVLEQNWKIADNSVAQGAKVINQLESDLDVSRQGLLSYKNSFESKANDLRKKADKVRDSTLLSVQEYHKIVSNASSTHSQALEEQRSLTQHNCNDMSSKLENCSTTTSDWNEQMSTELSLTHDKIDKFVTVELQKDIPTGTTPGKREFSYPRDLAATSPHERIVKRFRTKVDANRSAGFLGTPVQLHLSRY